VSLASISRSSHHPSLFDSNFLSSSFISHSSTKHSFCVSLPLLRVASPQMEALVSSSSVSLTSRSTESMELESLDSPRAHTPARSVIHSFSQSVNQRNPRPILPLRKCQLWHLKHFSVINNHPLFSFLHRIKHEKISNN
jgi:hypothetical protein